MQHTTWVQHLFAKERNTFTLEFVEINNNNNNKKKKKKKKKNPSNLPIRIAIRHCQFVSVTTFAQNIRATAQSNFPTPCILKTIANCSKNNDTNKETTQNQPLAKSKANKRP